MGDATVERLSVPTALVDRGAARVGVRQGRVLLLILVLIFAIKFALYLLDPIPKFYFGDSASYLWTALTGWIPEDRSFTYGFLLSVLAVKTRSLSDVVIFQVSLSAISAWIVSLCLIRYFRTKMSIAALGGILCAVGPLQLISERFILTEAVSTFLFAVYVLLCLEYLRSGRVVALVAIQLVALPMISIRLSNLPFVLVFSLLLPLIGPAGRRLWESLRQKSVHLRPFASSPLRLVIHLGLAIGISQAGLYGYKEWNGYLSDKQPAYIYADGLFLLAAVAPLVEPVDFPFAELRHPIFDNVRLDLRNRHLRISQCFNDGGLDTILVRKVRDKFGDDFRTNPNKLARKTALRAIKRNPGGFLELALDTWLDYFDTRYLAETVSREEGNMNKASEDFRHIIKTNFDQEYTDAWRHTCIQRWHKIALPWYEFLVVLPILFTGTAFFSRGRNTAELIYLGIAAWIFMMPATITAEPTVRYLVSLEWMTPLLIGALWVSLAPATVQRSPAS